MSAYQIPAVVQTALFYCYQLSAFSNWCCLEQTFSSLFNAAASGVESAALCAPAVQQRV